MFNRSVITDAESGVLVEHLIRIAKVIPIKTHRWLSDGKAHEIQTIRSIIANYPDMPPEKQYMISYMFESLSSKDGKTMGLYETLALHDAFYGPTVINEYQYRFVHFKELVLGLRDSIRTPLEVTNPDKVKEYKALLSFAFELTTKNLDITRSTYHRGLRVISAPYKDPELKAFVIRHMDRLDELILHVKSRESLDFELLTMLLENDGASALLEGAL